MALAVAATGLIMGITLFTDGNRKYYRVTKAWNGKERQVYVRIGKSEKKARIEAEKIESDLERRRIAFYRQKQRAGDGLIHRDGKIVGLQLQTRSRGGRKPCTEFKIRIKAPKKAVRFKSVSVNAYGIEDAFRKSVEKICDLRDIDTPGPVYAKLMRALPVYQAEYSRLTGEPGEQERSGEESHIEERQRGLLDQLKGSLQDLFKTRVNKKKQVR